MMHCLRRDGTEEVALRPFVQQRQQADTRLERDGLIDGEWKPTENNRRAKYYILTQKGRKRLDDETREWGRQATAIARILEAS